MTSTVSAIVCHYGSLALGEIQVPVDMHCGLNRKLFSPLEFNWNHLYDLPYKYWC